MRNFSLRIVIIYVILGGLYTFLSDRIVQHIVTDAFLLTKIQTYKGWGYVIVTGIIIYLLLQTQLEKLKNTDIILKNVERLNEQLKQTNNELRELYQRRNVLISSMGHELRAPLNIIIGFTDVLLKGYSGKIDEDQKRKLVIIKESSKHILSLISELIDIGKIELSHEKLSQDIFDLQNLIMEVVESLRPSAEKKGIEIEVKSKKTIDILSDRKRIKQILLNLISNSIKFTDKGGVYIDVIDSGDFVNIIIEDTGIGISRGDMKYLFEPFSISRFKNRPDVEGTGLGLYTCKRIADLLKAEITVESELNKGTKFTVRLPKNLGV